MDINKFTIHNGELYEVVGDRPLNRKFDVPELRLVNKLHFKSTSGGTIDFVFKMNSHTDPEWRDMFEKKYDKTPVQFSGDEITITVQPEELEKKVNMLKEALILTNTEYKRLAAEIKHRVEERITNEKAQELEKATIDMETEQKAKNAFENLRI